MAHVENSPRSLDPFRFFERLPEFSGDKNELYSFISLVDRVNPLLGQYDEISQLLFFDLIKSKLKGKACEIVEINFHVDSWEGIKQILINNFGEKNSAEELYDRLRSVVFRTNVIDFYNEIKDRLRSLNNRSRIDLGNNLNAGQIVVNNMRTALNVFKSKMPEPMKTVLACRNPNSLENAMDILFSSGYAYYGIEYGVNNYRKFDKTNNGNNPKTHSNVNGNYRVNRNNRTVHRFNLNRYNQHNHEHNTQYNHSNASGLDNNNRYQYQYNNNDGNRNSAQHSYNFTNNLSNSQNRQPFPEPMDINIVQKSEKVTDPLSTQGTFNIGNSIRTRNNDCNLSNQNGAIQNFHFQASADNYLI